MNYQTRLERLRERFLRANTKELLQSACVEGGAIVIYAQEHCVLHINESIKEMVVGTNVQNPSNEAIQANYFRCFASLESRDETFFNGIKRTSDCSVLAERYAAFCEEIADMMTTPKSEKKDSIGETPAKYVERIKKRFDKLKQGKSQSKAGKAMASELNDADWELYKSGLSGRPITTTKEAYFTGLAKRKT